MTQGKPVKGFTDDCATNNTVETKNNRPGEPIDASEPMHLRYNMMTAYDKNLPDHPQRVMQSLGIKYTHAIAQSVGDQWWFWNCINLPDTLPDYLSRLAPDPLEYVGRGLSYKEALEIEYLGLRLAGEL